jgi:hypothetical protein
LGVVSGLTSGVEGEEAAGLMSVLGTAVEGANLFSAATGLFSKTGGGATGSMAALLSRGGTGAAGGSAGASAAGGGAGMSSAALGLSKAAAAKATMNNAKIFNR